MKRILYILLISTLITSCGQWRSYQRPNLNIDTTHLYREKSTTDTLHLGQMPWKTFFTDSRLQQLIEKALLQNADLRKADLNIQQAESGLRVARLSFLPSLTLAPQGNLTSWDFGKASQTYSVPLQAQWQIDAFGTLRNAKKMSEMTLQQTQMMRHATKTAIIASTANLYYTLQMLRQQLSTTQATIKIWKKNVETMEALHKAGRATSAAVAQARANLLGLEASEPTLKTSISSAENALCLLLHETPHNIDTGELTDSQFPKELHTGIPLQTLNKRPDVKIAELRLAETFYATQKAKADFYPALTISATGTWTNKFGLIVNPGKILANAAAGLIQPIFAKGKLTAQLRIAKARQEAAAIDFETTLLRAGNEVSNAVTSYHNLSNSINKNKLLVAELKDNVETTSLLFTHGSSTSYLEVLSSRTQLLQARLKLISLRFDRTQHIISLYQALGGGQI